MDWRTRAGSRPGRRRIPTPRFRRRTASGSSSARALPEDAALDVSVRRRGREGHGRGDEPVTSGAAGELDADAPDDGTKLVYRTLRGTTQQVWERAVADGP